MTPIRFVLVLTAILAMFVHFVEVLYDNYTAEKGLTADWGFSCLITGTEKSILFDTGAKADVLLQNMAKMHVSPGAAEAAVISHNHGDHASGLVSVLEKNGKMTVHLPPSCPETTVQPVEKLGAKVVTVTKPVEICRGAFVSVKAYTNPVGETPISMGDPFVLQHGGRYYLFGTNASNEGFKCLESGDLVHWTPKGWAYQETEDSWAKSHYWAPEVKEYRGKFYMTYSAMPKKAETPRLLIALAVGDKPEGPYKDLHAPWFDFGYSAIDGHIFVDDDGKPYLYFSRNGVEDGYSFGIIYGAALADDLSKPVGEAVKLMEADQPWEKVRYAENRCNEGAFVLKRKGRYYMTYSANHTGFPHYGIGYATADKPLGPWVKASENPIAATNPETGVSGPGHSCITRSPDGKELFIVYHTHADPKKTSGERVVNIDRLQFDDDGKLKIKGPTRNSQPMPSGAADIPPDESGITTH